MALIPLVILAPTAVAKDCSESGNNGDEYPPNGVGPTVSLSTLDFYTGETYRTISPAAVPAQGGTSGVSMVPTVNQLKYGIYCNGTRFAINETNTYQGKTTVTFSWTMNGNYWVYLAQSTSTDGGGGSLIANGGYRNAWKVERGDYCSATLYFDSSTSPYTRRQVVQCGSGPTVDSASSGKQYPSTVLAFVKQNPTVSPSTLSTLEYNANGGSGSMSDDTVPTGSWVTVSNNGFTKTSSGGSCTFQYWRTSPSGGTRYDPGEEIQLNSDMTLYAQWSCPVPQYTLTYNKNASDATGNMSGTTANEGTSVNVKNNTFSRPGYHFLKWNTSPNGNGTSYTAGQSITLNSNVTLYAQWEPDIKYVNLNYDANTGNGSHDPTTVEEKNPATIPSDVNNSFSKPGYTLTGWNTEADGTGTPHQPGDTIQMESEDVTLYAQWEPNDVKLLYDANEGEGSHDPTVGKADGDITIPTDVNGSFHRDHYTLTGWNTNPNGSGTSYQQGGTVHMGITDQTLYAQWERIPVKVNYDPNTGNGSHDPTAGNAGEDITTPSDLNDSFNKPGYTLKGWNTEPTGTGTAYQPGDKVPMGDEDETLYAQWDPITVHLNYDPNTGEGSHEPTAGDAESTITIPEDVNDPFHKDHYKLTGWNTEKDGTGDSYKAGDPIKLGITDQTLYAQWERIPVQVNYDPNGGNGSHDPTKGDAGDDITVPDDLNDPFNKPGSILIGWNTKPDGTGTPYHPGDTIPMGDDSETIYAQWKELASILPGTGGSGKSIPAAPIAAGVVALIIASTAGVIFRRKTNR